MGNNAAITKFGLMGSLFAGIISILCFQVQAQVPVLEPIPEYLPQGIRNVMTARAADIERDLNLLITRNNKLRRYCVDVPEDSQKAEWCRQEQAALEKGKEEYIKSVNDFKKAVKKAVADEFSRKLQSETSRGEPVNAMLKNNVDSRNTYNYFKVIEQFKVESSVRYKSGERTYCNIFVWDVTRAMGAEIPHWVIKGDRKGRSAVRPNGSFIVGPDKRIEMRVNDIVDWLKRQGKTHGWRRVDVSMAQQVANGGCPTIAVWENPDPKKSGHIAVIRPGSVGDKRGTAISQAGRLVLDASHIGKGFNDPDFQKAVQYWYHN